MRLLPAFLLLLVLAAGPALWIARTRDLVGERAADTATLVWFVLAFVACGVFEHAFPRRMRFGRGRRVAVGIGITGTICLVFSLERTGIISSYTVDMLTVIGINAILAMSLNLINGFTGMFSIGHAGFMVIGAYVAGLLAAFAFRTAEVAFPLSLVLFVAGLLVAGVVAALAGFLVGLPTLRLRGDYLAIVTLGFGEIICTLLRFITFKQSVGESVYEVGGARGVSGIPGMPNLFGLSPSCIEFLYVFLTMLLAARAMRNFICSAHGRACLAIREDEVAAEIVGVNTVFYKVLVFTIGAFFAGVAGGLLAHHMKIIHPDMGGFMKSVDLLIIMYLGGVGSLSGAIAAAGALTVLSETLRALGHWRMVLYGALLVGMMLWRPEGLYGNREFWWLRAPQWSMPDEDSTP